MGTDFRVLFASLGDDDVIDIDEYGLLIKATASALYTRKHRGELAPLSHLSTKRTLLWRVSDLRAWIRGEKSATSSQTRRTSQGAEAGAEIGTSSKETLALTAPRRSGRPRKLHQGSASTTGVQR